MLYNILVYISETLTFVGPLHGLNNVLILIKDRDLYYLISWPSYFTLSNLQRKMSLSHLSLQHTYYITYSCCFVKWNKIL